MYVSCMYKVNTMELKDVQNTHSKERRTIRVNIRLTPSQNHFIIKNNLSITKIMNEALKQLGYDPNLDKEDSLWKDQNKKSRHWRAYRTNRKYR